MADTSVYTEHFDLPLPSSGNKLRADVQRLADFGVGVDALLDQQAQAIGAQQQKTNQLDTGKVEKVNGKGGKEITLRREDMAMGPANGATAVAFTYDAQGVITSVSETIDGNTAVATFTYNGDGTVKTIATTYKGRTRTETFAYDAGRVSGITAAEV